MHLTKKQSIKLTILILVVFFTLSIISIKLNEQKAQIANKILKEAGIDGISVTANTQVVLNNFKRSSMKDGQKQWEIIAKEGMIDPLSKIAKLKDTELSLFSKKHTVKLTAQKADISFEDNELKKAKLDKKIEINFNDEIFLSAQNAIYDKQKELVTTKSPVQIKSQFVDVSGNEMRVDIKNQIVTIKKNVISIIRGKDIDKIKGSDRKKEFSDIKEVKEKTKKDEIKLDTQNLQKLGKGAKRNKKNKNARKNKKAKK